MIYFAGRRNPGVTTASPSAIVSGAAVTPEAVTATGPAALPQNTVNPTVSTSKTHTKNGYENTIFTTKNYVYSTDGEGILQAPIVKSKTGAFSYPKKGTHYVIKPDTDNDFTVSDMSVTDSYLEQIVSLTDIESLLSGKRNGFQKDIIETWNVYQFFALKGRIYAILNANQLTYSSRDDDNYVYDEDFEDDYKTYDYKLSVVSFRASDGKDLRYETQMNTFLQEKLAKAYECCDYDGLNYWTVDTGTPLCPLGKGQWIIEFPTQFQEEDKRYKSDYYLYDVLTGNSTKIESREGQQMKEYKVRFKSYNGFC